MRRLLGLTMLQRGLSVAAYLVATMIIARLLTPAEVGVYSLAAAVMAIAGVVREFGISEYLMQAKELDERRVRAAFGVAIVVAWSIAAAILLLRNPIAQAYGEVGVARVLTVLALTFVFLPFATPVTALMYRDMQIERVLWIQTLALVVGHVVSVTLAWVGFDYMALAWGTVVNSACMVVALLLIRPASLRVLPSLSGAGPIWDYCAKFTGSAALEAVSRNAHEFIIGRAFGFATLGLYSRANGLFVQFNQNVGRGISRVLLPDFARHARSGATDLADRYGRVLENYTAIAWPFFGVVAVTAAEVIRVMFGPQWSAAAPLLRLMCLAAVIQAAYAFAGELLGGMGRPGARLKLTAVTAPLWIVVCFLASLGSVQAVAFATAIPALVALALYVRRLRSLVGFGLPELWAAVRKSSAIAVTVITASWLARQGAIAAGSGPVIVLAAAVLAAGVAWLASVRLTGHWLAGELRHYVASVTRAVARRSRSGPDSR